MAGVLLLLTTYFNMNDLRDTKDDMVSILPISTTTNNIADYTATTPATTFTEAITGAAPTDHQDKETTTTTTAILAAESVVVKEEL